MPVTIDDFLKALRESEIWSHEEVAALEQRLRSAQRAPDAQALAAELVRQGRLTQFQAANLCAGRGRSLLLGDYLLLEKIAQGSTGAVFKARHRRLNRI